MTAIISVLVILALSILVTRIGAVALVHTGLSRQAADFQARSAFTGVGFTTSEAENVVNHPVRRRVVATLMLLGNVGIITAISSLILGFVRVEEGAIGGVGRIAFLTAGVAAIILLARSAVIDRWLSGAIRWALDRWTDLRVRDYESLLHLSAEYDVGELEVAEGDWLADRAIGDLRLRQEGVTILGIEKGDGGYIGGPDGETVVEPGDVLLVYGRSRLLRELDERERGDEGDRAHDRAVAEQDAVKREERRRQEESVRRRGGRINGRRSGSTPPPDGAR